MQGQEDADMAYKDLQKQLIKTVLQIYAHSSIRNWK